MIFLICGQRKKRRMALIRSPSPADEDAVKTQGHASASSSTALPAPRPKRFSLGLFLGGMTFLGYLLGAAVMFFQLPSSDFLSKAFLGAHAWNERRQVPPPLPIHEIPRAAIGTIDKPGKTFDGFTLYICGSLELSSTQAFLMNMRGEVVHHWAVPFSEVWPLAPHIHLPIKDNQVGFFDGHLYPNGDLLVVFHTLEKLVNGCGLAKLDKNSNLIWKYDGNIHHQVEVGEDGTIYAIAHKLVDRMPRGLEFIPTPCLVDELVLLSPDGKLLREPISILEALRDSPYAPLLDSLSEDKRDLPVGLNLIRSLSLIHDRRREPLHLNSARLLERRLAARFPNFQAGQVLLSVRNLDALCMLDLQKQTVVWAARGPWLAQHDAQFLDNGHLLILDNLGATRGSRVLEYDPQTQAFPWSYPQGGDPSFLTTERGMCQRLPNGNTLIVDSSEGKLLEVTPERETVWTCSFPYSVNSARRFSREQLPFLTGDVHARP
jgi:hypothetical protein